MTRLPRPAALAAAGLLAACGDGTSPARTLDGVWGARVSILTDADSITLGIGQEGTEIRGFGVLRRVADPDQYSEIYSVHGSLTGESAELFLEPASAPGSAPMALRGTLRGRELSGTVFTSGGDRPLVLRLSDPGGGGVAGTYVLSSTAGGPSWWVPAFRDTVVALPDGRARRHRADSFITFSTLALWSRRGDWLMLEQLVYGGFGVSFVDSLRIESGTLVRRTPVDDGFTVVETYRRVP
jgi:hypothetical protein